VAVQLEYPPLLLVTISLLHEALGHVQYRLAGVEGTIFVRIDSIRQLNRADSLPIRGKRLEDPGLKGRVAYFTVNSVGHH
jgi:hypothetical protein